MVPNKESKKLSALLKGITSKNDFDSYCLNCLHSFRIKNKLKSHEKVCKNKDFCGVLLPSQKCNILKLNQYMKSDKTPCIIYADLGSWIKKIDGYVKNPEKCTKTKIGEHIPCRYSVSTTWEFGNI